MGVFGLLFLVVALVLIGVGIAIGCVVCVVLTLLLMLGIISSATGVGLYQRSASAAYRTFVYLSSAALGIPAGILSSLAFATEWSLQGGLVPVLAGGMAGLGAGLLVAFVFCGVTRRLLVPRAR